jgi:hypothetical protein
MWFRQQTMLQILRASVQLKRRNRITVMAGVISDLVRTDGTSVNSSSSGSGKSFKKQFLSMPAGPEREKLVLEAAIQQGKPTNLVPVTVPGPDGSSITYRVMPDYIMIDGVRATMAPLTAQKLANHFGMLLPTGKMSKQIYQAADTKVRAVPLSSSGYTDKDGVHHSGADVVKSKIGDSEAAVRYSELTDAEIAKKNTGSTGLISGHGKEILQPLGNPKDVSFGGWQGSDEKPLQPYTTAHKGGASQHSEYALYTRLVGDTVTIKTKDGKSVTTTMDKLLSDPTLGASLTDAHQIQNYNDKA